MLEAYALNDEIWIEPNDSRQKGISLKITKIGRLYITAVNDWGQTYKIDRYTFQCQEFYGQAFASQQTAADYKLVQQMFRHLRYYPSRTKIRLTHHRLKTPVSSGVFCFLFSEKTPLPRGGGFRNALVCKDFNFCGSFRGKPDKQLD